MSRPPFHLAFPVHDIDAARDFYGRVLACQVGRSTDRWIDFDFFGHQVTAHLRAGGNDTGTSRHEVDGDQVPVPHFGAVLEWRSWESLAARLRDEGVTFVIEPRVRFCGEPGEQGTFFVKDPSGNTLEFKTFRDMAGLFATD